MNRLLAFYAIALFIVLGLMAFLALNSAQPALPERPAEGAEQQAAAAGPEAVHGIPENIQRAIETGDPGECGPEGVEGSECAELAEFAGQYCGDGNIEEKVFCIAFLKGRKEYCGWIDLNWYSLTCAAIIEADFGQCNAITYWKNRARCISELATNLDGADCGFWVEADWRLFCRAQADFSPQGCDSIGQNRLREHCRETLAAEGGAH